MSISDRLRDLYRAASDRIYIDRLEILYQSATLVKARLYISPDLFVQFYRNERFDTTNMVLIYNQQRLYARDQLNGIWHRHPMRDPHIHDTSLAGQQAVSLTQFLDEVEAVMAAMDLP
jgi:hypothetical protein